MSKPTLFFSHSSKDKDMVLAIKNKVMQYTSGKSWLKTILQDEHLCIVPFCIQEPYPYLGD